MYFFFSATVNKSVARLSRARVWSIHSLRFFDGKLTRDEHQFTSSCHSPWGVETNDVDVRKKTRTFRSRGHSTSALDEFNIFVLFKTTRKRAFGYHYLRKLLTLTSLNCDYLRLGGKKWRASNAWELTRSVRWSHLSHIQLVSVINWEYCASPPPNEYCLDELTDEEWGMVFRLIITSMEESLELVEFSVRLLGVLSSNFHFRSSLLFVFFEKKINSGIHPNQ